MWKIIYQFKQSISSFLLFLALKFKAHNICAFILWLNIQKFKEINSNNKNKNIKKILVFPKSGGNEDLIEAFRNQNNDNFIFFSMPRIFLKKIYSFFFKDKNKYDYFTKISRPELLYKKKIYTEFLTKTFNSLNKFIQLDGFISFNIFYYAEKYFDEVCLNLNKKFIILHKESTFTPIEEKSAAKIYEKHNDKTSASKISVYSESQKRILIKSKIGKEKQIVVNGCPRSDYSFKLRNIKPKNNIIVFFLIEKKRGKRIVSKKSNLDWDNLYNKTLKFLLEYAKTNPKIKLILKGKTGIHNNLLKANFLSKNCIFINGGTGEKFLKDAKVVIAFNSTIVFESIASNRNLIIPNFNRENITKKELLYKIDNEDYFANSKSHFFKKLNLHLNSKYKNRKLISKERKILEYYLGNADGNSGKRLRTFLRNTIH